MLNSAAKRRENMKKTIAAIIATATLSATPAFADQFGECAIANYEQHLGVTATPSVRFAALMQFEVMRKVIAKISDSTGKNPGEAIMLLAENAAKNGSLTAEVSGVFISILPCVDHIKTGVQS